MLKSGGTLEMLLIIIMHNKRGYLQSLVRLANKQEITDVTIIECKDIGSYVVGIGTNYFFNQGNISSAYDKAFVAILKKDQVKHFLDSIENDEFLNLLNLEDKGFICTVPFQRIRNLALASP
ncbi:MAG: hypothetical protein ABIG61_04790 [Planctomycetota bacterium]